MWMHMVMSTSVCVQKVEQFDSNWIRLLKFYTDCKTLLSMSLQMFEFKYQFVIILPLLDYAHLYGLKAKPSSRPHTVCSVSYEEQ